MQASDLVLREEKHRQMTIAEFIRLIGLENDRLGLFMDGANMFYLQQKLGWFFNPATIYDVLSEHFVLSNAFWYLAQKTPLDQKSFLNMLISKGYTVRSKLIKEYWDPVARKTIYKGNMDIELAMDVVDTSRHFDVMLLFSGDNDYVPVVERMRYAGKRVVVVSGDGMIGMDIRSACDKYINMQSLETLFKKDTLELGINVGAEYRLPLQEVGFVDGKEAEEEEPASVEEEPTVINTFERPILRSPNSKVRHNKTARNSRHWS